jgi:hypothetical protein
VWRFFGSALLFGVTALAVVACGSKTDHPASGGGNEWTPAGTGGSGGVPAAASDFDPNRVHLWGALPQSVCPRGAITELDRPTTYTTGFECNATSPFLRGTRLLYQDPDRGNGVFEFVADGVSSADPAQYAYPKSPGANDIPVATPCPVENGTSKGPVSFVVGPTGRMLYACFETLRGNANHWYDDTGLEVFSHASYDIIALGTGNLALLAITATNEVWGTVPLAAPVRVPAVGWSNLGPAFAFRSSANGFHVVVFPKGATQMELWEIDVDDQAKRIGQYPVAKFDDKAYGVLTAFDVFYSYANLNGGDGGLGQANVTGVNRRTIVGENLIAYDQTSNPVQSPSRMFTGP